MRHAFVLGLLAVAGCVDQQVLDDLRGDEDHSHPVDVVAGQNAGGLLQGLAVAGRWQIPPDILAIGDEQDVTFNDAPPWDDGSNCSGGPTDGARTLRDHLLADFPQLSSIGIYNCRVIAGTNSMSLHGVGRALDLMLPTLDGAADNELGDPIAHWLIVNAEQIGIQTIIWDSTIWRVSRTPRSGEYTGSNPHRDHLHVEINIAASNESTPWFEAPFGPQACETLPPIGEEPLVVDDADECFAKFGPSQYWRREDGAGQSGLWWTNAFENDTPSNWARWSLPLAAPGEFLVEVYIDPAFGVHAATQYTVRASGTNHAVVIDQSAADGWTALGAFTFDAGGDEEVVVVDNTNAPVGDEPRIAVDALRIGPPEVAAPPLPPPPPPEEPGPHEEEDGPVVDDDDPGLIEQQHELPPSVEGCSATSMAPFAWVLLLIARRRAAGGKPPPYS